MKLTALLVAAAALYAALLTANTVMAAGEPGWQMPITSMSIDGDINATVLPNGVARVHSVYKMSASSYRLFKEMYNPLSTFVRRFNWGSSPVHITNLSVRADDANNRVIIDYVQQGAAVYLGNGRWRLEVIGPGSGAEVKLLSREGNRLTLMAIYAMTKYMKLTETLHLTLPGAASNIEFEPSEGAVYYTSPLPAGGKNGVMRLGGVALLVFGLLVLLAARRGREEVPPPLPEP